jgi:SAM-dependent methyltransferase
MRKLLYLFILLCCGFQLRAQQTVVDIVVNSDDHTTLEAAVIAAELADDLSGPGPFTVFAPTDAAFAALPMGTVDALLQDPTGDLANILLYHVLGQTALSTDLENGMMVQTLQGTDVTVTINGSGVFINDAQVTVADIAHTGLEDGDADVAILCLAMWGSNKEEYLTEAYRLLDPNGRLIIVEPKIGRAHV